MVLFFPIIAAIPTVIGVSEGIAHQRGENDASSTTEAEKEQMRKFTLECYCGVKRKKAKEIHGGSVVLRNGKLWILPKTTNAPPPAAASSSPHPFTGFYISYPDPELHPNTLGLVSSISDDPPMLNWIYIDRATRELKYGNRTQSREHIVGSWGWETGEESGPGGLTLIGSDGGYEGGVAVWKEKGVGGDGEEEEGGWELKWERDGEGSGAGDGKWEGGLSISLERKWVEEEKGKIDQQKKDDEKEGIEEGKKETGTAFQVTHTTVAASKKKKKKN